MRSVRTMLVFLAAGLSGCVSWLSSEKASDTAEGIRYSLPAPFLLVTPKSDGTMDVETVMLPDLSRTYTIRQPSFVASHTLNVELDNQMLKGLDLNADTSKVTGEAAQAYGDLRKAAIEAEAKQARDQSDKTAAAKKRVADAELAVAKAQAVVDYLEPEKDKPEIAPEYIKAQVALQQAKAELTAAEDDARSMGIEGFNIAKQAQNAPGPTAFGPVLYRIKQTAIDEKYKVELLAVSFGLDNNRQEVWQKEFETSKIGLPPEDKPAEFALDPPEDISKGKNSVLEVSTSVQVEVDPNKDKKNFAIRRINQDGSATELAERPDVIAFDGGRKLRISFPENLPNGDYKISMSLKVGKDTTFTRRDFRVLRR